ncbi:MAG: hypothetical protein E5V85_21865 [Mesorhizobium sp.]|nr:MAG: hypothetical protein E5V85_21865 [Mesorhizobium sp.]
MPIHKHRRWSYPIDWSELPQRVRFKRAKGRCERCAQPHGKTVAHLGDGRWWDEDGRCSGLSCSMWQRSQKARRLVSALLDRSWSRCASTWRSGEGEQLLGLPPCSTAPNR